MKVVAVTGAARGIGLATAARFLDEGWTVVGIDRDTPPEGARFAEFIRADLASEAAIAGAFASISTLDALVNNAAICPGASLAETTSTLWDEVFAINVRAAFFAIQRAHVMLRASRGAIVNVASVHAQASSPNIAAYAASKGALVAMSRALSVELASDGIRVNTVLPGAVDTEMLRAGFARQSHAASIDDDLAAIASRTPLGRIGSPDHIAAAITFLADRARSAFITGQTLVVDGGALARLSTE